MADKSVFTRLKRLFSTDVIIRNVGGNQIKVIDSGKIQSTGELETNSLMDRYNRIFSTSPAIHRHGSCRSPERGPNL